MVSFATVYNTLEYGNNAISILLYIPLFLNFKYWYQTRIRDYGYISLFFLFQILSGHSTAWTFRNNHITFQIYGSLYFLSQFFIVLVAIRAKWSNPPSYARYISYITLLSAVVYLLIPPDLFVRNWFIGQYFFNPANILIYSFIIYCFVTTEVEILSNSKAITAKYLWIIFCIIRINQHVMTYSYYIVLNRSFAEVSWGFLIVWSGNAFLGGILILVLHILFPEAVLITHEQILRAWKIYQKINLFDNPVADIGTTQIKSYLEGIPEPLTNKLLQK